MTAVVALVGSPSVSIEVIDPALKQALAVIKQGAIGVRVFGNALHCIGSRDADSGIHDKFHPSTRTRKADRDPLERPGITDCSTAFLDGNSKRPEHIVEPGCDTAGPEALQFVTDPIYRIVGKTTVRTEIGINQSDRGCKRRHWSGHHPGKTNTKNTKAHIARPPEFLFGPGTREVALSIEHQQNIAVTQLMPEGVLKARAIANLMRV